MALKIQHNPPGASRFLEAVGAIGYDVNQAIAELIDNSITYGAKNIRIDFHRIHETGSFFFRIADDGCGMDRRGLINAMKVGSDTVDSLENLGKYGMGLKIASFSQCRRFTTVSIRKYQRDRTKIHGFYWDIDHVKKVNDWEMVELEFKQLNKNVFFKDILKKYNTVILWEKIDKIDDILKIAQRPERIVGTITGKLEKFIRMTYHRFLDGSLGKEKTVKILLNDNILEAWDPFCREEKNTDVREKIDFTLKELPKTSKIIIESYILPTKEGTYRFSTIDAWKDAKGLLSWNDSQGIYIYRGNRLIQYGGWLGTREKDEHTKYARIAISFTPEHDEPFRIALNKTRSTLPHSLFEFLRDDRQIKKIISDSKARGGTESKSKPIDIPIIGLKNPMDPQDKKEKTSINSKEKDSTTHQQGEKLDSKRDNDEIIDVRTDNKQDKVQKIIPKIFFESGFNGRKTQLWDYSLVNDKITITINEEHPLIKSLNEKDQGNGEFLNFFKSIICAITQTEVELNNSMTDEKKIEKIEKLSQNIIKIIQADMVK